MEKTNRSIMQDDRPASNEYQQSTNRKQDVIRRHPTPHRRHERAHHSITTQKEG